MDQALQPSTSSDQLQLRKAPPPQHAEPTIAEKPNYTIFFKHPGYSDEYDQNILFILFAIDHPSGGLHYGTAFDACAIVAGNAWNGHFRETRDGTIVNMARDGLLMGKTYYFYVPGNHGDGPDSSPEAALRYPVFPTFQHWSFPHEDLPQHWIAKSSESDSRPLPTPSGLSGYIRARDNCCIVTGYEDYVEKAHLCPKQEFPWFISNGMGKYNDNRDLSGGWLMDDRTNAVLLRQDLHSSFDDRKFVVVPTVSGWIVHFLEWTKDQGPMYHNTPVSIHAGVSPSFLLARFAWAIFPLMRNFLDQGLSRKLRLRVELEDGSMVKETKAVSGDELRKISNPPKQNKRKARSATNVENDDEGPPPSNYSLLSSPKDTPSKNSSSNSSTTSRSSQSAKSSSTPSITFLHDDTADGDIKTLKRKMLKAQRPKDPKLLCCDYNKAERNTRLGRLGPRKYGGTHLCMQCIGLEYRADEELPELTQEDFEP